MKKFLSGFIVGGVLFTSISVFAEPLHQIAVSFNIKDVIVDGQKLPLAKQALNYNGTTYVPLRPLAESLGYTTKWNPEKQNVEVMKAKITRLLSSEEIKKAFKDNGLPLNPAKLSYFPLNKKTPESYQIGEMEHLHIYVYESYEERVRGRLEFEVIRERTDMIVPFIYEVDNALIFYVPFNTELNLHKKVDAAIAKLRDKKS
ncbi:MULTISPECIES: stalk domain-containing protein [Brevibacillus]|uniref:stalk domain-containing protein n=1 Tax=Brevibacillus TaxID=55080 RepID=UPI00156AFD4C|nr:MULTISPECIES: stalk domain-containing protein [Brevibacillus]UED67876.1 copper amine oxidase N-terminal domain-containing protein [Brevibacillus sp. HD3.3A]